MNSLNAPARHYGESEPFLDLPSVTLVVTDCLDAKRAERAIERCCDRTRFGAVKLLTSLPTDHPARVEIPPLLSHSSYSVFMLKRVFDYVNTQHMLIAQHDGWILNPAAWEPSWLGYDYIGPLFIHDHPIEARSVGSGGFSLRTRALMQWIAQNLPAWDGTEASTEAMMKFVGSYEDGVISITLRQQLAAVGFRTAPPEVAIKFAQGGNTDPTVHVERPFGFHGMWSNIDFAAGTVAPFPKREGSDVYPYINRS